MQSRTVEQGQFFDSDHCEKLDEVSRDPMDRPYDDQDPFITAHRAPGDERP